MLKQQMEGLFSYPIFQMVISARATWGCQKIAYIKPMKQCVSPKALTNLSQLGHKNHSIK